MGLANIVGQRVRINAWSTPKRTKAHLISLKIAHQPYPTQLVSIEEEGMDHTDIIHGVMICHPRKSNECRMSEGVLTTARTMKVAWYTWICLARVLIAPVETRSIHIPTARMVKNAASCKKTKNARAIYRHQDPLRLEDCDLKY